MLRYYEPLDKEYERDSKKRDPILGFRGQYRFMSNFFMRDIELHDLVFKSGEHAFMWHKSDDRDYKKQIMAAPTAQEAKRLGNNNRLRAMGLLRENWEDDPDARIKVMYDVVKAKFKDITLHVMLLQTGLRYLEETNTWNDTFWGRCNGNGLGHLGRVTMVVRHEARVRRKNRN